MCLLRVNDKERALRRALLCTREPHMLKVLPIAVLAIFTAVSSYAQVLSGSIVGQVLDTTSAGVPGASVRLTHRETNQSRTAVTSGSGEYAFQSLPGGVYDIAITKEGFQTFK